MNCPKHGISYTVVVERIGEGGDSTHMYCPQCLKSEITEVFTSQSGSVLTAVLPKRDATQ